MDRRHFLRFIVAGLSLSLLPSRLLAAQQGDMMSIEKISKSKPEWQTILSAEQFDVLRNAGTERAFSSPLNKQYATGTYVCAGCSLPLFASSSKFDSGTGWPSFFTPIQASIETKRDFKLFLPRTEYHCARCDGHQGHVFNDGPEPTGKRYCNNGIALNFIAKT